MRVLVACEFSGRVRDAFLAAGHDAWSCDILPCELDSQDRHIQGNVIEQLSDGWDMMVAHPPCTYLTTAANKWMADIYREKYPRRLYDRLDSIHFFIDLWMAPIPRIAIENPRGIMSSVLRKPDQIIQPYQFGDPEQKATCLWLKNLPRLVSTPDDTLFEKKTYVEGRAQNVFLAAPSAERWKDRSRTPMGFARAMGQQWGSLSTKEDPNG